ncbi:hypothetical protein Lal_00044269 [Lupinus albus]|nr:hypothetical protein Lal_00044269 [Lupinus albus]
MEQSRPKRSKHQPLVYEDERSARLPLGTVVTPTIHSFCKKPVMAKFQGRKPTYIRIGDCSWVKENFDPTEVYKSFLRGPHLYIQGQLTKAGSLSVENRLLHYIIAYILVQRNTNHAQPTSKLLPYSIFISRIVDYLRIDVSDTIIVEYTDKDHLVGESLIHKMGIYKYGSTWQYQEDYTTFGLDLSDDDNQDGTDNQHATTQGEPSGSAPQNSAFGFD